ncbi:MAG: hypothetical protein V4750_04645, partial [Pseudomonadota bacterium]
MTRDVNTFDPYNADRPLMLKCSCGADHAPGEHAAVTAESYSRDFIEATLVKALLPSEPLRRRFLPAVGATTARAASHATAVASSAEAVGARSASSRAAGAAGVASTTA